MQLDAYINMITLYVSFFYSDAVLRVKAVNQLRLHTWVEIIHHKGTSQFSPVHLDTSYSVIIITCPGMYVFGSLICNKYVKITVLICSAIQWIAGWLSSC